MQPRAPTPDHARLSQVRDDLRVMRPRSPSRVADRARLEDGWPPEQRRRRLIAAVERELASGPDEGE